MLQYYLRMSTSKTLGKVIFFSVILFSFAFSAHAAGTTTRYFVKSQSGILKKTLGVRHSFENGFSTDLTGFQVRIARIMGADIASVKTLQILPATAFPQKPTVHDGVQKDHPDLQERITGCKDFTTSQTAIAEQCDDQNGHGTHVAGIIAADGGTSGRGIYGIAPMAHIMGYKVCADDGSCYADDVAMAIRVATDEQAQIITMSFGTDSDIQLVHDAINYAESKGVLMVAAAGNDGPFFDSIDYPAAYPEVIAVGALDKNMNVPDWSSRGTNDATGPNSIDEGDIEFAAPGVNIVSTWNNGGYETLSGTSMAAPFVAGGVARYFDVMSDQHPTTDDIRSELHSSALRSNLASDVDAIGYGMPRGK